MAIAHNIYTKTSYFGYNLFVLRDTYRAWPERLNFWADMTNIST
jgi:hypothetical protein